MLAVCLGLKSISWSQSGHKKPALSLWQEVGLSRVLSEREYPGLVWSLMEQRRMWLSLQRLQKVQTGLHSRCGSGPPDVGMQVREGGREEEGITGMPVVPTVLMIRPVLQVRKIQNWLDMNFLILNQTPGMFLLIKTVMLLFFLCSQSAQ